MYIYVLLFACYFLRCIYPQILTAALSTTDRYFDSKLNPTRIGKWAANPQNRKALWAKLVNIIEEN
jgi:hypothetical protein